MEQLIKINVTDNVFVVRRRIMAGESINIDGIDVCFDQSLALGHKVAARDIKAGEQIIKFGVPIGYAVVDIKPGAHIHVHNMKSNYIPTYTTDEFINH